MLVTIANGGTDIVYVSVANKTLAPGESITFSRTVADLDREVSLKDLVQMGVGVTLAYVAEPHDAVSPGLGPVPPSYGKPVLPDPTQTARGTMIWETVVGQPAWCNGTAWVDATGTPI